MTTPDERKRDLGALTDADRANDAIAAYIAAQERVSELTRLLDEARTARYEAAADLPADGEHRGALGRLARYFGENLGVVELHKKRGRRARKLHATG